MSVFSVLRRAWHIVPAPVRARAARMGPVRRAKLVVRPTQSDVHNDIYNAEYYRDVDATTGKSAPAIARSIVRDLAPRTLLDVGCGTGAMLDALRAQSVDGLGLEYSEAGLAYCRARKLRVAKFDLEAEQLAPPATPFDVVLSAEVAEHLPASLADRYLDVLVGQGSTIVFTAATPGQGGTDHVNEQPHAYWIERFACRGFTLDEPLSLAWRAEWAASDVAWWYSKNLMIFRRT
jgi:cyclopropane fatty-acyl-phospholipid synthase-like methyltransferase